MQTALSLIVTRIKKAGWIIPAGLLSGCSLSPAIPVIGAYYPGWLFCIIASLIVTLITRRIIQRIAKNLSYAGIVYTAIFALYAMLFWLVFF
ncbi:hypothetical protein DU258_19850 [Salmonella enterica subsp. enterica]|uniref:Uncharacterized protein YtcA n=1 Tax=Salmonella enterica subsp. enterica serovar Macclesfield str. S-1643 TaxID=1242107 RepID=A0A2C9P4X2_SALET|nr:YtcA family lipoprotein [Salmonella enterica]EAA5485842.1 hypothetical protein [Salmonella enterica subsp. enterica serovar Kouka]EBG2395182.1 hypothetical protein [Salmonella enterica subsp. enterica serovar Everleigh]EBS1108728.1 hypothetical protein [Salmonella enterica subsp. enterica serovar Eingedi]EBV2193674.1 hypothetical protein [Salmonella enterica subsp. enterica serovar Afula]ECH9260521.1 hypothetical protein [Salmonella enterica subsp. enterica]